MENHFVVRHLRYPAAPGIHMALMGLVWWLVGSAVDMGVEGLMAAAGGNWLETRIACALAAMGLCLSTLVVTVYRTRRARRPNRPGVEGSGPNSLIVEDMTNLPYRPSVFIGSSAEGLQIARALQAELEGTTDYLAERWDTGTFAPGSYTLESLIQMAKRVDFAILIATGEDTVISRGTEMAAVRDNIIFEFGLFLGTLGRERVYYLSVNDAKLPSDLLGLTRLTYQARPGRSIRAGLNSAVVDAQGIMDELGPRKRSPESAQHSAADPMVEKVAKEALAIPSSATPDLMPSVLATVHKENALKALEDEIQWLCSNATNQGWSLVKNNPTMLRLRSPKGKEFTLTRRRPAGTRVDLRMFVAELRANGLRVNRALQGAVEDSPFG